MVNFLLPYSQCHSLFWAKNTYGKMRKTHLFTHTCRHTFSTLTVWQRLADGLLASKVLYGRMQLFAKPLSRLECLQSLEKQRETMKTHWVFWSEELPLAAGHRYETKIYTPLTHECPEPEEMKGVDWLQEIWLESFFGVSVSPTGKQWLL